MSKKNKKKKKKMSPEKLRRKRKLREKRRRNKENKKQKALLVMKEIYDNTTTKDFENWFVELYGSSWEEDEREVIDPSYTPSPTMSLFFDEFKSMANMKEHTRVGRVNSYIHENGVVILTNKITQHEKRDMNGQHFFNSENHIYLDWIVADVDNRKKGWGTEMMEIITFLASKYNFTIKLIAGGSNQDWKQNDIRFTKYVSGGKYTTRELASWYETFGFGPDLRLFPNIMKDMKENKKPSKGLYSNMMYPSGSVEKYLKFPSLKGYDYKNGFSYSSTNDCMKRMLYEN